MMIDYRSLQSVAELQQVVALEIAIWGLDPLDAVPVNIMRPLSQHGGSVIGAFDGDRMVGMALAFPTRIGRRWILWSHMAGVLPERQGQGIGFGLKQAQRRWALEHGFDEMRWTYDPLQRGNANFNLHRLGATAATYHVDYYGVMPDAINRHSASDRIEAIWKLKDRRVAALAAGEPLRSPVDGLQSAAFALCMDTDGAPRASAGSDGTARHRLVQVPVSLSALTPAQIAAWRLALRGALQRAFAAGYTAVDFIEWDGAACYVLQAPEAWFLYVLRCNDDSLYTGITLDIKTRLKRHQAGRGAAYTAARRPVTLMGAWQLPNRSAALKAELAFKRLPRPAKLSLLRQRLPFQEAAFVDNAAHAHDE